jgi:hypothetical protein
LERYAALHKLAGHAYHVIVQQVLGSGLGQCSDRGQKLGIHVTRVDAEVAVACRGYGSVTRHFEGDRENEAEIVIGVLANEIDAPGRAIESGGGVGPVMPAKAVYDFVR